MLSNLSVLFYFQTWEFKYASNYTQWKRVGEFVSGSKLRLLIMNIHRQVIRGSMKWEENVEWQDKGWMGTGKACKNDSWYAFQKMLGSFHFFSLMLVPENKKTSYIPP